MRINILNFNVNNWECLSLRENRTLKSFAQQIAAIICRVFNYLSDLYEAIRPRGNSRTSVIISQPQSAVSTQIDPHFLQKNSFVSFFQQYSDTKRECAEAAALLLVSIAQPGEEDQIFPALSKIDFDSINDWANPTTLALIWQQALIHFFEGVDHYSFEDSPETAKQIVIKALKRQQNLYFHGTHKQHIQSIMENGLSATHAQQDEQVDRIHQIAQAVLGESTRLMGWRYQNCVVQTDNQVQKFFFVTGNPHNALGYAKNAPEWFSQFCCAGMNDSQAVYFHRNKRAAEGYLNERLEKWKKSLDQQDTRKRPLSIEEAKEIKQFFDQKWLYYQDNHPVVFTVRLPQEEGRSTLEYFQSAFQILKPGTDLDAASPQDIREVFTTMLANLTHEKALEMTVPSGELGYFILSKG